MFVFYGVPVCCVPECCVSTSICVSCAFFFFFFGSFSSVSLVFTIPDSLF